MSTVSALRFHGTDRILAQYGQEWRIYRWPSWTLESSGSGWAIPDPAGKRLAVRRSDAVETEDGVVDLTSLKERPIRDIAWDGDGFLVVVGDLALTPGHIPGPSLLPIPDKGITAQEFGSYPEQGMSLWRVPLQGGTPKRLTAASGIERLQGPIGLDAAHVLAHLYHFPAYGHSASSRWVRIHRETGVREDWFPSLQGAIMQLEPCPGDRRHAFLHSDVAQTFPFWWRLAIREADGSVRYPLPESLRLTGERPVWSPDGRWVAVTAFEGIRIVVVVVTMDDTGERKTYDWRRVGDSEAAYRLPVVSCDGRIVAVRDFPGAEPEIRELCEDGASFPVQVRGVESSSDRPARERRSLCRYERVFWRHAEDLLEGVLAVPVNGSEPWPIIVDVHGGPVNGLHLGRLANLEEWCRRGYAVFAPDYRGSGILGKDKMMETFVGTEGAYERACGDVLSGVDHLIARGQADPERLFLFGHSAGASLVNRIVTLDHRFLAAVSWEGHADGALAFSLAWGGGGLQFVQSERGGYGGTPWETPERYRRQSAVTRVGAVRTPMLMLHGDHETAQAVAWYTALRAHGVETKLIFYRGEGHVMSRPENQEDVYDRAVAWFSIHEGPRQR